MSNNNNPIEEDSRWADQHYSDLSKYEALEKEVAELKEAVKALANLWRGTEEHRWNSLGSKNSYTSDELKEILIMQWPQVQGSANNRLLKYIGSMSFDSSKLIPVLRRLKEGGEL